MTKGFSKNIDSIVNFVSNPPKQLTAREVADIVRAFAGHPQAGKTNEQILSDETLIAMANNVHTRMSEKDQNYRAEHEHIYTRYVAAQSGDPMTVKMVKMQAAYDQLKRDFLSDAQIVPEATAIRDLMLKRFGTSEKTTQLSQLIEQMKNPKTMFD